MRMIDINNDKRIYMDGDTITSRRSGCEPMPESELFTRLGMAVQLRHSLDIAIADMRSLINEEEGQ